MSRKITTTRKVHPRINPKKEKGDGAHRAKTEVRNPVMGVMWLTMGKVIFAPLLAAGASMSAVWGDAGEMSRAACEPISTKGNIVAQVVCPGCMMKLIQCCKCSHNINPEDPQMIAACGKVKRSPSGLMKGVHVRQHHPSLASEDNDSGGNDWMDPDDGGLDDSHHSMPKDGLSEEECVSDDDAEIDREIEAAQQYVDMFTRLDLDPNEEDEENGENSSP